MLRYVGLDVHKVWTQVARHLPDPAVAGPWPSPASFAALVRSGAPLAWTRWRTCAKRPGCGGKRRRLPTLSQ